MLIVGLNGSPNKNGGTRFLLDKVLETARSMGAETAVIDVGEVLNTSKHVFCTACSSPCTAVCYKGTPLEEAFELMKKADGLVLGSPVYFGSVSAQLKALFDKSRKQRGEKAFYNKVAAGVTTGASRFGGQETTLKAMHDMMLVQGMIIVGDGYVEADMGHHGACAQKPAEKDENAAARAAILGRRLFEVCQATRAIR